MEATTATARVETTGPPFSGFNYLGHDWTTPDPFSRTLPKRSASWSPCDSASNHRLTLPASTIGEMSDFYHQFLSSMAGVGGQQQNPNLNLQDGSMLPLQQPPPMPLGTIPISNPYQSLGYFAGFPEPIMFNAPKSQRNRRKSAPGLDHIKHRRTRSGCYTCRNRRVKVCQGFLLLADRERT